MYKWIVMVKAKVFNKNNNVNERREIYKHAKI